MLELTYSAGFQRDLKLMKKRRYNLCLLSEIVSNLAQEIPLKPKHRDHALSGRYTGARECHIQPDWLLVYVVRDGELQLVRTGTHSDLF